MKHFEMQIKTAFFFKHFGSTFRMYFECTLRKHIVKYFKMCVQRAFKGELNVA